MQGQISLSNRFLCLLRVQSKIKDTAVIQNSRRRKLTLKRLAVKTTEGGCFKSFARYLAGECYLAESTVKAYQRDMKHFREFFESTGKRKISRLTISDLADYVDWLHKRNLAQKTMSRHIVSLRLFFVICNWRVSYRTIPLNSLAVKSYGIAFRKCYRRKRWNGCSLLPYRVIHIGGVIVRYSKCCMRPVAVFRKWKI